MQPSTRWLTAAALLAVLCLAGRSPEVAIGVGKSVRVGAVVDLTGLGGIYGRSVREGLLLARDGINSAGGIDGRLLDLRIDDGASSVGNIRQIYLKDIADHTLVALIGPTLSSEAVLIDPVAQQQGLPVLATSNTAVGITAIGDYIFRVSLGDAEIIPYVLRRVAARLHLRRVAIIDDGQNTATRDEARIFATTAHTLSLRVIDSETYTTGTLTFGAAFARIRAARPDAVLVAALAQDGARLLIQGRRAGVTAPFIGANGLNAPSVLAAAGPAAEGLIVGTTWYAGNTAAYNRAFIAAYTARFHHAPDQYAAQAYDGLHVLATALAHAGPGASRRAIRDALAGVSGVRVVLGATGTFSFTANRDAKLQPTVQIVRHGRFIAYAGA